MASSTLPQVIAGLAGVLLSLAFKFVPGLKTWYEGLSTEAKSGLMALVVVAVGAGAFLLSCAGVQPVFACSQDGAWLLVQCVFFALAGNQSAYTLTRNLAPPAQPPRYVYDPATGQHVRIDGSANHSTIITAGRDGSTH